MIIAWHMDQTVIKRTTDRALHGRVDRTAYRLQRPFPAFVVPFTGAWIETQIPTVSA